MDRQMKGGAGTLHVDDGGEGGLPVVLVHASAGDGAQWAAQLTHLRRTRRAVALDLRGHGRSELKEDAALDLEAFADDVGSAVDGLGLGRFVLVGHSLGGAVCAVYAARAPGRVAGLLLLDPASDGRGIPPEQAQGMLAALRSEAWADAVAAHWEPMLAPSRPEVRAQVLAQVRTTRREAVAGPLEALLTFDPVPVLRAYPGPRLSVVTAFNHEPGSYHRLVPELPSRSLEGTGHWLQLDAPERVNAELDRFLASLEGGVR